MRLILKPNVVLAEPVELPSLVFLPDTVQRTVVYVIRQSAYADVSIGDKVLCTPQAGLKIRSNGSRFVLLDAGDILARLE